MVEKYGDMIKHVTYPDRFAQEVETTIAQVSSLAADPDEGHSFLRSGCCSQAAAA